MANELVHTCLQEDRLVVCKDVKNWKTPYCTRGKYHAGFGTWLAIVPTQYKKVLGEAVHSVVNSEFDSTSHQPINDSYVKNCLIRINKYLQKILN